MIQQFTCTGFKNINVDNMEFGRINLLIGPNNAGKSNFIKALSFGANMLSNGKKGEKGFLSEIKRNGYQSIINLTTKEKTISMLWRIALLNSSFDYKIDFHVGERLEDFYIETEKLDAAEMEEKYKKTFNYFECDGKKA